MSGPITRQRRQRVSVLESTELPSNLQSNGRRVRSNTRNQGGPKKKIGCIDPSSDVHDLSSSCALLLYPQAHILEQVKDQLLPPPNPSAFSIEDDANCHNSDSSPNPEFFTPPPKPKPTASSTLERPSLETDINGLVGGQSPSRVTNPSSPSKSILHQTFSVPKLSVNKPQSTLPCQDNQNYSPFHNQGKISHRMFSMDKLSSQSANFSQATSTFDLSVRDSIAEGYSLSHKWDMVANYNYFSTLHQRRMSEISSHATQHIKALKLDFGNEASLTEDFPEINTTPNLKSGRERTGRQRNRLYALRRDNQPRSKSLSASLPSTSRSDKPFNMSSTDYTKCENLLNDSLQRYREILTSLQPQYEQAACHALKFGSHSGGQPDNRIPTSFHSVNQLSNSCAIIVSDVDVLGYRGLGHYSILKPIKINNDQVWCALERLDGDIKAIHQLRRPSSFCNRVPLQQTLCSSTASVSDHSTDIKTNISRRVSKWEGRLLRWISRRRLSNHFWQLISMSVEKDCPPGLLNFIFPVHSDIFRDRDNWCMVQPYCHGGALADFLTWLAENRVSSASSIPASKTTRRDKGRSKQTKFLNPWDTGLCYVTGRMLYDIIEWLHYVHIRVGITLHGQWAFVRQQSQAGSMKSLQESYLSSIDPKHLDRISGLHPGLILMRVDEFMADKLQADIPLTSKSDSVCSEWQSSIFKELMERQPVNFKMNFVIYNLGRARDKHQLRDDENLFLSSCLKDWQALCQIVQLLMDFADSAEAKNTFYSHLKTLLGNGSIPTSMAVESVLESLRNAGYGTI